MEILARGVGRRKEAVAQVQIVKGTGQFLINQIPVQQYLHNNTCAILSVKSPLTVLNSLTSDSNLLSDSPLEQSSSPAASQLGSKIPKEFETEAKGPTEQQNNVNTLNSIENIDTIVKVKGGGLIGQAEAIKLGLARALCELNDSTNSNLSFNSDQVRKQLKDKGYLTQDSRVKERKKYGLKKARKATQYNKR
jgi:small subunit ribosomal protein S9